jgi:hypothetical protein
LLSPLYKKKRRNQEEKRTKNTEHQRQSKTSLRDEVMKTSGKKKETNT